MTEDREKQWVEQDISHLQSTLKRYLARGNAIPDDLEQDPDTFVRWFVDFSFKPKSEDRRPKYERTRREHSEDAEDRILDDCIPDHAVMLVSNMLRFFSMKKEDRDFLRRARTANIYWYGEPVDMFRSIAIARQDQRKKT